MPRHTRRYVIEYKGAPADGPGSVGGGNVRGTGARKTAGTCTRRAEVWASTEIQALYRAAQRLGGDSHRIIGRHL